jgi:hypothetical protein
MESWVQVDSLTFNRFVAGLFKAAEPKTGLVRDMGGVKDVANKVIIDKE